MITIHKYQFELGGEFEIEMPEKARVLGVQLQGEDETPTMWAIVDTDKPIVKRKFKGCWTGEELPELFFTHLYIATIQDYYVWHIFEVLNPAKGAVTNTMYNNFDPKEAPQENAGEQAAADATVQNQAGEAGEPAPEEEKGEE